MSLVSAMALELTVQPCALIEYKAVAIAVKAFYCNDWLASLVGSKMYTTTCVLPRQVPRQKLSHIGIEQ